jgi:hypothetical protein
VSTVFIPREGSEYTEHPSGLVVEYRDASHRYWLHHDGQRIDVPSVTGVLKVLDKPALIPWAESRGIAGAVKAMQLGEIHPDDEASVANAVGIVRTLKLGADAARDQGADRGTSLHDALELYVKTGTVPNVGAFPIEHRGYVQALCRWLLTARPEPTAVEVCVGSIEHGFAGRLDLRANIDGRDLVVDLKSSATARVYDEAHLQCAAYIGGSIECGYDEPDGGIVVSIGSDGEFVVSECEAEYDDFLAILEVQQRVKALKKRRKAAER